MNKESAELTLPFVSIIIPTYKDWERLDICLQALAKQNYPKKKFEVIVVDNDFGSVFPDSLTKESNFIFESEGKPGSYNARNKGLKVSKGEIIGFTDSDCQPDKNWIYNAIVLFNQNIEYDRIGGKIEVFPSRTHANVAELYDLVFAFQQDKNVTLGRSVTANLFVKSYLFSTIGSFNGDLISGGDFEWSDCATANQSKIMYGEQVIVKHPARKSLKELTKKVKRTASYIKVQKRKGVVSCLLEFIYNSRPPIRDLKIVNQRGVDINTFEKTKVFFVRYYLRLTRAYSILKINFGGDIYDDKDKV